MTAGIDILRMRNPAVMYDKLLIPTDGSDIATRAGRFAVAVAERFGAELHIICVEEGRRRNENWTDAAIDPVLEAAADTNISTETAVVSAPRSIHGTIIGYAEDNEIEAIIMGTHGRTGVNRFLLGSVAEQTLRESPVPVLTVHEDTAIDFAIDNILVPTDGSAGSSAAADEAINLATETGATLHLLTVRQSGPEEDDVPEEEPFSSIVPQAEAAGIKSVQTAIRQGKPHMEIAGYAAEADIDCIVMGTHGRGGVRRYLLGSVTERTVRFSQVPVITVKPEEVAATVEFLDYEIIKEHGWSVDDPDLFAKAADASLPNQAYGAIEVGQGEYILEAAERAGYNWPFHCRAGACVNCAGILLSGEVEMEQNRSLSDEEIDEENLRLTCVATPASESIQLIYNAKELDLLADRVF